MSTPHCRPPHLAERSAGVCTLPATMQVGCQASSGRCPSATLDESERAYSFASQMIPMDVAFVKAPRCCLNT